MKIKNLVLSILTVAALWSCSKDDGPSTPTAKTPTISSFTPPSGPVGTVITINGTNFSATKTDNTVKIGSTKANVGAATTTKLTVTVPTGATTGAVSVSVGGKTVTGKTFTVTQPEPENNAPEISPQEFEVIESIADTEEIGTVTASDADDDQLTFVIAEDTDGLFEISEAGVLSLLEGKKLDFATSQQHTITVQVNDGTDNATAEITINVTEDKAPQSDNHVFEAEETISDDVVIGTVGASDPEEQTLVFSIKANDNDLFEITEDGELSLAPGKSLDYQAATSHEITVAISDGFNEIEVAVTINVTDITSAEDPSAFVTTWKTDMDGESIIIALNSDYNYDFTINWGDGTVEEHQYNIPNAISISHDYEAAGNHTVAIQGQFPAIRMKDSSTPEKLIGIEQWGAIEWQSMEYAFLGCTNLSEYTATDVPDLSNVVTMSNMFGQCTQFNGDIGDWDTSNVTIMASVFSAATSFDQDISGWNTANVTKMNAMFSSAASFNQDISGWVTLNATTMSGMFRDANSFNQDIGSWNTSKVEFMTQMFDGASKFNQNISGWNVSNVTKMFKMFSGAVSFDQNLGGWDLSALEDAEFMLDNSGMSIQNYSNTLIGWSTQPFLNDFLIIGTAGLEYCLGSSGDDARDALKSTWNWVFNGDSGIFCP